MNKRQVLDIVLIIFGLYFLMYFVQYMIITTFQLFSMQESQFAKNGAYIFMMWVYLLIPLAVSALCLFKREKLLNILIGKSEQRESPQTNSMPCYGRLAFWIQILGLYYLISSVAQAIPQLAVMILRSSQYSYKYFWWREMGGSILTIIVAFLIIWKSEVVANFINKITKQPQSK